MLRSLEYNQWIAKHDVVYPYSGILFSHKENEELIYATTQMNCETWYTNDTRYARPYSVWSDF
jgi:hypothetical protein